jgi:hypothetical protein
MVSSSAGAASERLVEDRAAFSTAMVERGRLFGRSEPRDGGRLCHESGERGAPPAVEDEVRLVRLASESNRESFSLVGESEKSVALSMAPDERTGRDRGLPEDSRSGEKRPMPSAAGLRLTRCEVGEGVLAGEDF